MSVDARASASPIAFAPACIVHTAIYKLSHTVAFEENIEVPSAHTHTTMRPWAKIRIYNVTNMRFNGNQLTFTVDLCTLNLEKKTVFSVTNMCALNVIMNSSNVHRK